jgi:hypothetical protein
VLRAFGVSESPPPRLEGTIPLPDGRRLGYGEFGDARGRLGAPLRCSQTSSCTCARARATSAGSPSPTMLATLADLWRQRT